MTKEKVTDRIFEAEEILDTKKVHSRGRIYLGSKYEGKKVKVAVLEVED